ncbi:ATP phosphoribosyltransferase [Magnetofaba australis]|uniref:ATP phosphoribosyltransferase n=1 Tax=Magnetofaba australis IT-1 TaxID=1434232 RepID=A0A1Y2K1Z6_9PROT|nr:ATP phosphoribosyltransferase [Magnetofaba australis]OSM02060.1 putative ATP phosphoribosyltransferase [Magnetofaba australis IT-1]
MSLLTVGLPKGSLETSTLELFAQAGWNIATRSRNYFPSVDDAELTLKLIKPQEMALYVADGSLDLGFTGYDWIMEQDCLDKVHTVCELEYSKSSNQPCRWVVVVPEDSPIQSIKDLHGKRIATELLNTTRRMLGEHGVEAEILYSWGATEAKAVEGVVDAVVEITETGSTIRANKLRIVHELFTTSTQMIAHPAAMQDPAKSAKIEQIRLMLNAALTARRKSMLKLNVSQANLDAVSQLLPSLHAPTINPLSETGWFAVESVVDKKQVRELIPKLAAAGAEGILEYDLQKVV